MKATYFKLTEAITNEQLAEQSLGDNPAQIIANDMLDKRLLLRGTIEKCSFPVRSKCGKYKGECQIKEAFVCARTGYVLTLDLIAGYEDQDVQCSNYQRVAPRDISDLKEVKQVAFCDVITGKPFIFKGKHWVKESECTATRCDNPASLYNLDSAEVCSAAFYKEYK